MVAVIDGVADLRTFLQSNCEDIVAVEDWRDWWDEMEQGVGDSYCRQEVVYLVEYVFVIGDLKRDFDNHHWGEDQSVLCWGMDWMKSLWEVDLYGMVCGKCGVFVGEK